MVNFSRGLMHVVAGAVAFGFFSALFPMIVGHPFNLSMHLPPFLAGGVSGLLLFKWRLESDRKKEKLLHGNRILRAIRLVNQAAVRAKDKDSLAHDICDALVKNHGCFSAWIALLDETGRWSSFAAAGLGEEFSPIIAGMKKGEMVACCRKLLSRPEVVVTGEPAAHCGDCPLAWGYEGRGAMSARLEYGGVLYGLLTLSVPETHVFDAEEKQLITDIAADIALGLRALELENARDIADKALQKSMRDLGERVKELNCLLELSNLVERPGATLEEIASGAIHLIPPAFQNPGATCARIVLDGATHQMENFRETNRKLENEIIVNGRAEGRLTVCCLGDETGDGEPPFLEEEKNLIHIISGRLGKIVELYRYQAALRESETRFRALCENSLTGISILRGSRVVYQNKEQERLFGPLPRSHIMIDPGRIHPDDVEKVTRFNRRIASFRDPAGDVDFRYFPGSDGKNPIWISCRTSVIEHQGVESILINTMDVTRIRELEMLLFVQDKMASLGRAAAGIAHEIRSPLSGINIYLNTLEKFISRGEGEEKIKEIFRHLFSASRKIDSVIGRVMDFSKPGQPMFVMMDINQPVEEALKLSSVTLRKCGIRLEKSLAANPPGLRLDPQRIEEVVLNLIHNAIDALKHATGEKRIMVKTSVEDDHIVVRVLDSGPGVPPDDQARVFDPFYTTKPDSTGIGLSICHRVIMDHTGAISVRESPWGGADFGFTIPL